MAKFNDIAPGDNFSIRCPVLLEFDCIYPVAQKSHDFKTPTG